jgi:hypothetical protein
VQIARDGIFRDVAVDVKVPASILRLESHIPSSGRYYTRVSAIDEDHFEGPFSYVARTLVLATTRAESGGGMSTIVIDPPDAFCVRVGNVPLTRIDGQPIVVPTAEPVLVKCAPTRTDPMTAFFLN